MYFGDIPLVIAECHVALHAPATPRGSLGLVMFLRSAQRISVRLLHCLGHLEIHKSWNACRTSPSTASTGSGTWMETERELRDCRREVRLSCLAMRGRPSLWFTPVLPQDGGRSRHPLHLSSIPTRSGTSASARSATTVASPATDHSPGSFSRLSRGQRTVPMVY